MTTEEITELLNAFNASRPQVCQTMNFNAPIGQQIAHVDKIEAHFDKDMGIQIANAEDVGVRSECTPSAAIGDNMPIEEDLFNFIHPQVEESNALAIHKEVKRLVGRYGVKDICEYLSEMASVGKILLPQKLNIAYDELVRMGMPTGDGYAIKTFEKYYRK